MSGSRDTDTDRTSTGDATLAPDLLEILVCPIDHGRLRLAGAELTCTICGRVYPIEDGIPNMLVPTA